MKNKRFILALAGHIGSGKGFFGDYLKSKYTISTHKFSDCLGDIINRLHLDLQRTYYQDLSTMLRNYFGEDILSKVLLNDIQNDKTPLVLIDGVRRPSDIKSFEKIDNFYLIFIESALRIRYLRIKGRGEKPDEINKTFKEFEKDSNSEAEMQIENLKKIANFVVENNSSKENYIKNIDSVLAKIGFKK